MDQNKIFKILGFSGETEAAVKAAISKKGIKSAARSAYEGKMPDFPICKSFPLNRLAVVVLLLCKKYDDYAAIGVPENIIAETFRDVSLRANLYRRKTGKVGISKEDAFWFRHIMNTAIFKIGVLQFQPFEMIYLDEELFGEPYMTFSQEQKRKLPTGAQVINCHIQAGADLSIDAVESSFCRAQTFFKKIFPEINFKAFICYSWLLYPKMLNRLASSSKIRSFAENFEIIGGVQDNEQAFENLFGKAYKLPPKLKNPTSLQKLAAENPSLFGFACGVKYL